MHATRLHFLSRIIAIASLFLSGTALAMEVDPADVPELHMSDVAGLTPNQRSLASYLDLLCARGAASDGRTLGAAQGHAVCAGLGDGAPPDDQVRAALAAIAPEPLIVAADTAQDLTATQNMNVMQRIAALRSGAHGIQLSGLKVQADDLHVAPDTMNAVWRPTVDRFLGGMLSGADGAGRLGLFANGTVRLGNAKSTGAAVADRIDLTSGIDYRLLEKFALGASVGYTNLNVENDPARGALAIESWRGTLFGTYYEKDYFHVDGLLAYGNGAYDSRRRIDYGDVQAIARGATSGRQVSGELNGAFDLKHGPWTFGPHVGAYFLDADVARLDEVGAEGFDLTLGSQNAKSTRINAGARLAMAIGAPWGDLTPHINADYVRDLADRVGVVDVRLANDPFAAGRSGAANAASLRTDQPEAGYFAWSVGATAQFARAVSGFVNYRSFAGADNFTSSELTCGVRFQTKL